MKANELSAVLLAVALLAILIRAPGCSGAGASGGENAVKFTGPDGVTCYALYSNYQPIGGNCK